MIIQHFNTLSKQDQQNKLLTDGIFLAEREDGPFRIMLYKLESFYVEVYTNKQNSCLNRYKSFATTELLDPYLTGIKIDML